MVLWLRDLRWRARRRGSLPAARSALLGLAHALRRRIYLRREGYLTCVDVAALGGGPGPSGPAIVTFEASDGDLDRVQEAVGPAACASLRRRAAEGDAIILAEIDGDIAGYCALSFRPTYAREADCVVPVQEGEAYGHSAFTLPRYRRRGVYTAMLAASLKLARDRGVSRVWGVVAIPNEPSRSGLRTKTPARAVAAAGSIRVLGLPFRWQRPLAEGEQL